jgi:hypothetical protein
MSHLQGMPSGSPSADDRTVPVDEPAEPMTEAVLGELELDRAADEGMIEPRGPQVELPGPEDEPRGPRVDVPGTEVPRPGDEPTEPVVGGGGTNGPPVPAT